MSQSIPKASAPKGKNSLLYHLQATDNLLAYLEHLATQGDIVQLGMLPAYYVNHPDYVQQILVTQSKSFHKPSTVKYAVEQILGVNNLFSSDDEVWRALRKAVQLAFHMRRIASYLDFMVGSTEELLNSWQDNTRVDMQSAMMDLTMSITSKSLFNLDLVDARAGEAIIDFLDAFNERITSPIPIPAWLPIKSNRTMKNALKVADEVLLPIIEERQNSGEDTGDLLSMLLIAQRDDETGILTDLQVRTEIYNLFAAGYEVTANTMLFTLYLITSHPEIAERLIAEIDAVLSNEDVTLDSLNKMPYLEQVIKESMRLMPITALVSRTAIEDVMIGDYRIPKNAQVLVAPWTLHRRTDIFPEPEEFKPERFEPENEKDIPKNAYIPFSTGPRICLGSAFAMLQLRSTLAIILRNYHLEIPVDYVFEPIWRFNTRPKHGLEIIVRQR